MRSPGVSGSGRGPSCGVWGLAPAGEGRTLPGRRCRRPSPPAPPASRRLPRCSCVLSPGGGGGVHSRAADFPPSGGAPARGAPAKRASRHLLPYQRAHLALPDSRSESSCPTWPAGPRCSVFQDDSSQKADGDVADAVPEVQETVQVIPGSKLLWRVNTRPPNSAQVRTPAPRPSPHP